MNLYRKPKRSSFNFGTNSIGSVVYYKIKSSIQDKIKSYLSEEAALLRGPFGAVLVAREDGEGQDNATVSGRLPLLYFTMYSVKYRCRRIRYARGVDDLSQLSLPGRVFAQKTPEYCQDRDCFINENEFSLKYYAEFCGIGCYGAFPEFHLSGDDGDGDVLQQSCFGELEYLYFGPHSWDWD
ncbi:OLC1v1030071C1 [Oldenlandia corymbosa var. corymbosa]|uniref:OLC1v1030071C1 n=1 Tax=Oldenlandia corymbosa var. corymbosa TaxID=529605 RepID=A0AAV1CF43_OLDCO|nr:OLC1v1030071C1 [Oldenlandia corymbosa var. corymbosa]